MERVYYKFTFTPAFPHCHVKPKINLPVSLSCDQIFCKLPVYLSSENLNQASYVNDNFCTVFSKIIKHISAGCCWTSVVIMFNISKANETCRVLNRNEIQSNAVPSKQLPWEASESSSQLLADFRGEVKKTGSSRKIWSVLPGRPMLNVWHQDSSSSQGRSLPSPLHGTWIFPLGRMSRSSSNLPKPFHTHHTQKILAAFSQISFWRDLPLKSLPFASLFQSIYLCATTSFLCQRGVNSPWATKVLGQIKSLPSAWYNQGKKSQEGMTEQSLQFGWIRRN